MRKKDIQGYEGLYVITDHGYVWSVKRLVVHKTNKNNVIKRGDHYLKSTLSRGYVKYVLCKDGITNDYYAHRLVAKAFIENKDNKPFVNHIDGNKLNNHYANLEWVTASENMIHASKIGLNKSEFKKGSQNISSKLNDNDVVQIKDLLRNEIPAYLISCLFNISTTSIYKIKLGQQWSHIK